MRSDLRIALVTPEAAPFAKSGELAEFCASLPRYLTSLGFKVSLIMPKYSTPQIASLHAASAFPEISVPLNGERVKASVLRAEQKGYDIYLADSPKYFLRENIYVPPGTTWTTMNVLSSSAAALEFAQAGLSPTSHRQNWPTARSGFPRVRRDT
jgi:starch synthase